MKIFLSSTIRDLEELRLNLEKFITDMGYTPQLSELSDILYDPQKHTHKSCVDAISKADMLVVIITHRFGGKIDQSVISSLNFEILSKASKKTSLLNEPNNISITQAEVIKAIECNIPIYTFVNNDVYHSHYYDLKNKGNSIIHPDFEQQDTAKYIFNFIDFISGRYNNNNFEKYKNSEDIIQHLKKQWSLYFTELLKKQKVQDIQEPCNADWTIAEIKNSHTGLISQSSDKSDLFFFLLSVKDCEQSREKIVQLHSEKFEEIKLEAMYDLMGSWDLLIKFRASNKEASEFEEEIISNLLDINMIDSNKDKTFGRRKMINVFFQNRTIQGLLDKDIDQPIYYTLLQNNESYEKYRSNRAFLFLEAPKTIDSKVRKTFLKRLDKKIENQLGSKIIESICEGENEIIIETFSSCSQSSHINHLNKSIESILTTYGLQKYTLFCYHHDEDYLLKNSQGVLL
jgi:hypothetical protein